MTTLEDIIGKTIAGYRYGIAPESGLSYNTREGEYEPGVSMACVGFGKEVSSFAVDAQSNRKYYYIGKIAGFGGDDEICLTDVRRVSRNEYLSALKETVDVSNLVVDCYADRMIRLIESGWNIGLTVEDVEDFRISHKKTF